MSKRPKFTNSATTNALNSHLKEVGSKKCLISLEKAVDDLDYGLCLNRKHSQANNQNTKKYNTALLELFNFLCKRTWNEIYQTRKTQEYGHEPLPLQTLRINNIKTYFIDKCGKSKDDKIDTFRFGSQQFRACGFRQMDVFYLVCVDYDFSLYDHGE